MKKAFFKTPSITQKAKQEFLESSLDQSVLAAESLHPSQTLLLQAKDFPKKYSGSYGSRHAYRQGFFLPLHQPKFVRDANNTTLSSCVTDAFERLKEHRLTYKNAIGYSFEPVGWRHDDPKKKFVPFVSLAKALLLYAYAEKPSEDGKINSEISLDNIYDNHPYVRDTGAIIHVSVPSEKQNHKKYKIKYCRVPVKDNLKVALSLRSDFPYGEPPEYKRFDDSMSRVGTRFMQHEVAGYLKLVSEYKRTGTSSLLDHNPFAIFNPQVMDSYMKLRNQSLVYDPELKSKSKLRDLRLAEQSLLLGRMIGVYGKDALRTPTDPKIKDYPCFK